MRPVCRRCDMHIFSERCLQTASRPKRVVVLGGACLERLTACLVVNTQNGVVSAWDCRMLRFQFSSRCGLLTNYSISIAISISHWKDSGRKVVYVRSTPISICDCDGKVRAIALRLRYGYGYTVTPRHR